MATPLRAATPPPTRAEARGGDKDVFIGASMTAQRVRSRIVRAAKVDATVLISGESGVGKELVAREIHDRSPRANQPFVALNCAAIPESLLEAELFGHEPGAFTDAKGRRRGAFERAHLGTLFLDEVGDLSPTAQPKLLRALESGEIVRVGGETARPIDLRIIAATNQNLSEKCQKGHFRDDLFFRLRVLNIEVPPLRERPEDIPMLVRHFLRSTNSEGRRIGEPPREVSRAALEYLLRYHWPGNVRELKAAISRAVTMSPNRVLDATSFELEPPYPVRNRLEGLLELDWRAARDGFAAAYAERLLQQNSGNVRQAASVAGIARRSMYKMIDRLGLKAGRDRRLSRPSDGVAPRKTS